jgi:hypothetical protein
MKKLEPIGQELSVDSSLDKDLLAYKDGDEFEIVVKVKKMGEHTHSIGKTEHMVDLQILEIECMDEDEDEGEEEGDETNQEID